jgi:hypothetical protein
MQHPKTGEPLAILGWRNNGQPIMPILGASEDDDEVSTDASGTVANEVTPSEGVDETPEQTASDTVARGEYEKLMQRMKNADKRADAAEAKAKSYEDKDKSELELAQSRLAEIETENAQLAEAVRTQALENAFLKSNSVKWHDPRLALAQVNLDGVVKDDGEIDETALASAISVLAKDKPFLVKNDESSDDGEDKPVSGLKANGPKKDKKQLDREKLLMKYPALRR